MKFARHLAFLSALFALSAAPSSPAFAAIPSTATVEGLLLSAGGGPAADGNYSVIFAIYTAETGGSPIWSEGPISIAAKGGQFSHMLGSKTALVPADLKLANAWLSVQIGTDPELPRRPLGATLYSLRSVVAESLDCSGCVKVGSLDAAVLQPYAKTTDLATYAKAADLTVYAKASDLAAYAKTADLGAYAKAADLAGYAKATDLADYVKAASLAKVAGSGDYADLKNAPALAKVATSGDYKDLANAPAIPKVGSPCGTGLFSKGYNNDGSLNCAALKEGDLPPDGIDEVSNGLISNQFTDSQSGTADVGIKDGLGAGVTDTLTFPDIGIAQKISVSMAIANSDLSGVKVELFAPGVGTPYVLYDGGKTGTALTAAFNDTTPIVSGDLNGDWIGKNIKGVWSMTVRDTKAGGGTGGIDGKFSWTINIQTLSSKKIAVKGNMFVAGAVIVGTDPVCDATRAGGLRWTGASLQLCNGTIWTGLLGPDGTSAAAAGKDCRSIKVSMPASLDGVYWIDPNGGNTADAFKVWCDMTTAGGGWTLVLSARRLAPANFDRHGTSAVDPNIATINPTLQSKYLLQNTVTINDGMRFVCFDNETPRSSLSGAPVDVAFPKATADLFNSGYMQQASPINVSDSSNWYDTTGNKRIGSNGNDDFYMGGPITTPQYENVNWGWVDAKGSTCSNSVMHWSTNPGNMTSWANGALNVGDWFILVR